MFCSGKPVIIVVTATVKQEFWGADDFSPSDDVRNSWEGLGIRVEVHTGPKHNEYFLNGKQITRDEAWDYAEKIVGKHLGRADWDW